MFLQGRIHLCTIPKHVSTLETTAAACGGICGMAWRCCLWRTGFSRWYSRWERAQTSWNFSISPRTQTSCGTHSTNSRTSNTSPLWRPKLETSWIRYAGGWQELFPTYGGDAAYCGAHIGIHGEACIYPWDCKVLQDTPECVEVLLSLRTIRTPFLLEKTVCLQGDDATLYLHQKVTNLGAVKQQFMWGHHPAFGFPFLDDSVRLHVTGAPTLTVPAGTISHRCPFDRETVGTWPTLPGKDGREIDMSRAYRSEDRLYIEYALSDLTEGSYELVNHNTDLGIRLNWDKMIFPYLWIWGLYGGIETYPWYGRAYVMAVEPWSTMPADYNGACSGLLELESDASLETDVSATAFLWKDR